MACLYTSMDIPKEIENLNVIYFQCTVFKSLSINQLYDFFNNLVNEINITTNGESEIFCTDKNNHNKLSDIRGTGYDYIG